MGQDLGGEYLVGSPQGLIKLQEIGLPGLLSPEGLTGARRCISQMSLVKADRKISSFGLLKEPISLTGTCPSVC